MASLGNNKIRLFVFSAVTLRERAVGAKTPTYKISNDAQYTTRNKTRKLRNACLNFKAASKRIAA